MKRTRPRLAGITMIELLVVVAILGLLIVALSRNFQSSLQRAADAQRKTDIKKISQALEQYYNDRAGYPASLAVGSGSTCGTTTTLSAYMKDVPCDPNGGTTRPYLYIPQGTSYTGSRGDTVHRGYRLLTALQYKADPQIAEIGCPTGCGGLMADGTTTVATSYNFGLAANAQVLVP